ncbi:hypothetical protein BGZ65_000996, partial [Modicella reniformis]
MPKVILILNRCFLCEDEDSYNTPHNVRRHLITKHDLTLPARQAGQRFRNTPSTTYVAVATTGSVEHFACPSCCFSCDKKTDLKSHVKISHLPQAPSSSSSSPSSSPSSSSLMKRKRSTAEGDSTSTTSTDPELSSRKE